MSRWSLNDWYRYLESQFEKAESPTEPSEKPMAEPVPPPTPEMPSSPAEASPRSATESAEGEKGRAIVSIRVPHFAEFVPLLSQELNWQPPQPAAAEMPSREPAVAQEPASDGPRLRKRAGRTKRAPESVVPPEADETWAKLPRYLRYLAEWTDDRVTRKYYPVRGRHESREELIARLTDPVLTLEETARLLGVCPATVRRYTDRGWLRCFRTEGNQRRFKLSDIVAFLEEQALRQPRGNRHKPDDETAP
ncbi:MAG: helix-turn-helix domain-containing protein [Fimbriimonadales bacterium]|nr:helix-turn-helix domain-containing protein [Fimbriimonadales bacterium]